MVQVKSIAVMSRWTDVILLGTTIDRSQQAG